MTVYLTFSESGVTAPETSEIKSEIQTIFTNAFGSNLNLDDSTPQGYVIDRLTEIVANQNSQMLFIINQMNPSINQEPFQDAIGQLYFLERKPATPTVVQCVCTGLAGTVIYGLDSANPAQAQNVNGDLFVCTNTTTIPVSGTVTVQFQSVQTGEIPAPANTVNRIYRQVPGWDTINNPAAGVLGQLKENRIAYEERRKNSLSLYATGSREAVYAKVYNVDNVTDVVVVENDTSEDQTIQGVTLTDHSIYICVVGGDNNDIALAIRNGKSGGCATNGSISILIEGDYLPIKFERPTAINLYIHITVSDNGNLSASYEDEIKQAILDNFNGEDGSSRITIGQTIYASRFYAPVTSLGIDIDSLTISRDNSTFATSTEYDLDELAVLSEDNITITVG